MLGKNRLPDYNIFTSIIREDELLLKWSIRHPRRLPGYPFYRRLLLTRQMKTALEVVSRAATNTSKIASNIIESFQRYIFRFSQSPNHLIWLSWGSAKHFHNNHTINHSSCSLFSYTAEPSLVPFQSCVTACPLSYATPRLYCAVAFPWSADSRNHFTASLLSFMTPCPCAYRNPSLDCASAFPWSADSRYHFTASLGSSCF